MEDQRKIYLRLGLVLVGFVAVYMVAAFLVPRMFVSMTKAAPASIISINESKVLGEKILAKADGVDKCKVNVFILDKGGKGVAGKGVTLEGASGVNPQQAVTNSDGKASFTVVSKVEGQLTITASVEGTPLPRELKLTFRN